jgi:2-methylisocitrate lyase-like PEP mutase family enzyme
VTALATAARRFRALHHGEHPVVLPNVWDCASARAFAEAGFGALATSSGAVAATLGYADGQGTPVREMLAAVARIARCVDVPVTADMEAGYGLAPAELAGRLAEAGIVGCNLEDSDPASRALTDPGQQADYLAAVHDAAGESLVINARVDVFVRDRPAGAERDAVANAIERARRYLAAGADCCYPILAPFGALPALVTEIDGPVNAMCHPGSPSLAELSATGVARITFGSSLHNRATADLRKAATALRAETIASPRR